MASRLREHAGLPGEQALDLRAQARPIALGELEDWRPRLSRVIWRTCLPMRSEATRRNVK